MTEPLNLLSVIGFGGDAPGGLISHGDLLIYPLGSAIVLRAKDDLKAQEFLQGHTGKVSALALSPSGRYLASGQSTYLGFVADICVWDLESRSLIHRLQLQKVKIQALSFSADEQFLASLGGPDDNSLVLWDVATGQPVCGTPTGSNFTLCMRFFSRASDKIVTAGNNNLTVWTYDPDINKLVGQDAQLGALQRNVRSLEVDAMDAYAYAGTTSGDVLQINLERVLLRNTGPGKGPVSQGVMAEALLPSGDLLVGGGDGTLAVMHTTGEASATNPKQLKKMLITSSIRLEGGVTSIALEPPAREAATVRGSPHRSARAQAAAAAAAVVFSAHVGTSACNVYRVTAYGDGRFTHELVQTAHCDRINALAFPAGYGEVFATAGPGGIRLWGLAGAKELLRIAVPNLECNCVAFTPDGKSVVSGWSDGKIRAFGPQSGKLLYAINDAHHKGVIAVAASADSQRLISGGGEGMVRVWHIGKANQTMEASMKDHKGPVNSIALAASGQEAVSASSDGSCIVWDLTSHRKRASFFASTFFMAAAYHPDDSQLVTAGTDRKISYWDASDGSAIRIIEASPTETVNCLAVDPEGEAIVSGSGDRLVKLWGYDEGHCYYAGVAHSGAVNAVAITPDRRHIVSVGSEGAVCVWQYAPPKAPADLA